jgi:hypothetical protein
VKNFFISKNIDDLFDFAESMKSLGFRTFWLKKPSAPKYSPYKTLSKFELAHFSVLGLHSVRHVQYVSTNGIGIEPLNSEL